MNHDLNKELIEILKKFDKAQFNKFFDFIASPYCYKDTKLRQSLGQLKALLTFLEKNIDNNASLTRKKASKVVMVDNNEKNKSKTSTEKKEELVNERPLNSSLNTTMTELLNLLKKFIYWESVRTDNTREFKQEMALAHFYSDKNMTQNFNNTINDVYTAFEKTHTVKDSTYYYHRFEMEYLSGIYLITQDTPKGIATLPDIIYNLDNFYAVNIMELLCLFKNSEKINKSDVQLSSFVYPFLDDIKALAEQNKTDIPILKIYNKILNILYQDNPNRKDILEFEELLENCEDDLPYEKLMDMLVYARNFWGYRNMAGANIDTLKDVYNINKRHWKDGAANNFLTKYGVLSPNIAQNIANSTLSLHALVTENNNETEYSKWILGFLNTLSDNKNFKEDGDAKDILNLCYAKYYAQFKQYDHEAMYAVYQYKKYSNIYRGASAALIYLEIIYNIKNKDFDDTLAEFKSWLSRKTQRLPDDKKKFIMGQVNEKVAFIRSQPPMPKKPNKI